MAMSPPRWRRQLMRSMSSPGCASRRHGSRRRVFAVIRQEDLFEAGLVTGEVDDLAAIDRPHEIRKGAADRASNRVAMDLDVVDARRRPDGVNRWHPRELDLHLVDPDVVELVQAGRSD